MWRWLIILAAVFTSTLTYHPIKRSSQRYCGPELYTALQVLCDGIYNTMSKKSLSGGMDIEGYGQPDESEPPFPFSSRSNALSFMTRGFMRHKRGVYDECCKKSCTVTELASYCGEKE